ncbi:hypothetical protein LTR27_006486 [Elasticomyces elasticus]|nr:hypothetical protein LTR27_006486 [Elasticomyces elasticus]
MPDQTQTPTRGAEEIVRELDGYYSTVDEALITASASLAIASAEVKKAISAATDMHDAAGELVRVMTGEKHDLAQKNHQVKEPGYRDGGRKSSTYGAE